MFFATASSRRVQSSLLTGLETRQGCLFLMTGEAGIGKTMQLLVLEAVLRVAGETVMVHDGADGTASWLDRLAGAGGERGGKPIIDLVDGAEGFSAATIERLVAALRMSAGQGFPARLVIAARSEIEPRLYSLVGAALSTQAAFNWLRLDGVDGFDVESLILHRLRRAGYSDVSPITPEALRRIIDGSGGVPGRILDLATRELEPVWRRGATVGAVDVGTRARRHPMRRAFAAASLPLLVAGAWMLFPSDVIRRAETSAGRFVVETFAGTPRHVTRETPILGSPTAAIPPVGDVVAKAGGSIGPATSIRLEPIVPSGDEGGYGTETTVAVVHVAQAASTGSDGDEAPVANRTTPAPAAAARLGDVAATPTPVVAPQNSDQASDEVEAAVVHPAVSVATQVEAPRASVAPSSPDGSIAAPTITLAQSAVPSALSGEQLATLIRRGDEQLRDGSIAGARLFYDRAAIAGDAKAMRALARTYDPQELRRLGVVGLNADPERAQFWLKKAEETEAASRARPK